MDCFGCTLNLAMAGLRSRLDALLKQADLAMDRAKRARPGAAHIFTADPDRGEHDETPPWHIPPPDAGPTSSSSLVGDAV